ncbi:thioredoxin [Sporothrix schenckii 1099-18]|uniref:Thioredoxin n=2 Tax=Sporothrix schenckii TaxID=29908 RepID=U7Q2M0_SPOS1|nr:thioredoxin [Sporothrix schenckii 1099-18]ERT02149.1 thioredoxin [Sporothrix schenckii ATCC 58251]KJR80638.1 thioredoxin [Sporothrix schenckii 1099-18]
MSKVTHISSAAQFAGLLKSSKVVIADFFATWCGPCVTIAPVYEKIAAQLGRENAVTFVKIDTDVQKDIAAKYRITAMPTFLLFRDGNEIERVQGADPRKLESLVNKLVREAGSAGGASSNGSGGEGSSGDAGGWWSGASVPRGYADITNHVEVQRTELLNVDDAAAGNVRVLFGGGKPSGKSEALSASSADWVESDTDEQLMLFIPLQSNAKLHTLQITSHPTDDAARPELLKLYSNSPHNLGFDEAEDTLATQEVTIKPTDWNEQGTASIPLKFVKFQNITSLVVFVVSAQDGAEKVRLDRVRLIGEAGEKREMGKLEKIGDEQGE